MTEKEVAAFLNVSVSKLQKDRIAGRNLIFITIGKSVRYRMEDVLAFIELNMKQSTSAVSQSGSEVNENV